MSDEFPDGIFTRCPMCEEVINMGMPTEASEEGVRECPYCEEEFFWEGIPTSWLIQLVVGFVLATFLFLVFFVDGCSSLDSTSCMGSGSP